jgi:hypothetical protein
LGSLLKLQHDCQGGKVTNQLGEPFISHLSYMQSAGKTSKQFKT